MTSGRRPDLCEFRQSLGRHSNEVSCGAVARLTGADIDQCRVSAGACEACCQHPLPSDARLNPVLASLTYAAADRLIQRHSDDTPVRVRAHQTRALATRWLASDENNSRISPAQFNEPRRPHAHATTSSPRVRIGLVGRVTGFGLAHLNRDFAQHIEIDRWLTPDEDAPLPDLSCRFDSTSRNLAAREIEAWLDGLDVVVFAELPMYTHLVPVARQLGVRVICIPMWEWLQPGMEWLDKVDLMLCPTRHTADVLSEWKTRFRFAWDIETIPWPIDVIAFPFRERRVCRSFVYVHGSGGNEALRADGTPAGFQRKGCDVLFEAARRVPQIPIIVYANEDDVPTPPPNVELRPPPKHNFQLYTDGDICIQPSRWEGLGLPLLECQASGLPLIVPDAPPMNEHAPLATIPTSLEPVFLGPDLCIPSAVINPAALADVMQSVFNTDITEASRRTRQFVEHDHNWETWQSRIADVVNTPASQPVP